MPVTKTTRPKRRKELNEKIAATQPGEENIILEEVQSHVSARKISRSPLIINSSRRGALQAINRPNSLLGM